MEKLTFKEGFLEYLADCKRRNLSEDTLKHYEESFKQIFKVIPEDLPVEEFNKQWFNRFIDEESAKGLSSYTVYTRCIDLRTIVNYFIQEDYCDYFAIRMPKYTYELKEPYTDEEIKILLQKPNRNCSFIEYQTWVAINILLSTGIRSKSLRYLKCSDVDFNNAVLKVNVTKNGKPLILPLNADCLKVLNNYLRRREGGPDDYLICNQYGELLASSDWRKHLRAYNNARGVEGGSHKFRHTFAKKWIMSGGSMLTLSRILGHADMRTTQKYVNLLVTDLAQEMAGFNLLNDYQPKEKQFTSKRKKF